MRTRPTGLRLGKISEKPILIVRTIEQLSALRTPDSVYDEAEKHASNDYDPPNREEHAEQGLRFTCKTHGDPCNKGKQPGEKEDRCENTELTDSAQLHVRTTRLFWVLGRRCGAAATRCASRSADISRMANRCIVAFQWRHVNQVSDRRQQGT